MPPTIFTANAAHTPKATTEAQRMALLVASACAAAIAQFANNELDDASRALLFANENLRLVTQPELRTACTRLIQATADLTVHIDIDRLLSEQGPTP